ncbi:unnamed protein product [Ceratitis capitata]|uniref:(Mediterranean fruit fly) hypothetical protein n=1 Tax=Ceratitis capitata TaxID=7213 RepID=A0A811USH0_CERCA|nr:unnamed protein product [Ceratitis capitata]
MEEFLLEKIKSHVQEHKSQIGFRPSHSTSHALTILSDFVCTNLNRRQTTILVSLDLEKAFDTAWIEGIIYKMYRIFKFNKNLCRMLYCYLKDRSFYVTNDGQNSITRDIIAGVPQGYHNTCDIQVIIYADDILVLGSHARIAQANAKINNYLDDIHVYFNKWKLKLNICKSECTIIKGLRKNLFPNARKFTPQFFINGEVINVKDQIKYLGVVLDDRFTFKKHLDYTLAKAKKLFFSYANLMRRPVGLRTYIKLNIYKQIIRPIISYAHPI